MKIHDWISAGLLVFIAICYAGQMGSSKSDNSDAQLRHDSTLATIESDTSALSRAWNSYGREPDTMYCGKSKGQYWCDSCPKWEKYDIFIMREHE